MTDTLPQCGLYLRINADSDVTITAPALRQAAFVINRSAYEKNMHVVEIETGPALDSETLGALIELTKAEGLIALIKGSAETASALNADGVLVSSIEALVTSRNLLGDDKIIGVACGADQKLAEDARANGADYVVFGTAGNPYPLPKLLSHWSTATDIPAVALGAINNDNAGDLVKAGATFLDCTDYVWGHQKGVKQAISNMLYAIELASTKTPH